MDFVRFRRCALDVNVRVGNGGFTCWFRLLVCDVAAVTGVRMSGVLGGDSVVGCFRRYALVFIVRVGNGGFTCWLLMCDVVAVTGARMGGVLGGDSVAGSASVK